MRIIWHIILTLILFSLWAGFALLVVNPLFYQDLPGYQIGRICIWEYVMLGVAMSAAWFIIKGWGYPILIDDNGHQRWTLHRNYGYCFVIYFFVLVVVGIWQFWLFSQTFP